MFLGNPLDSYTVNSYIWNYNFDYNLKVARRKVANYNKLNDTIIDDFQVIDVIYCNGAESGVSAVKEGKCNIFSYVNISIFNQWTCFVISAMLQGSIK